MSSAAQGDCGAIVWTWAGDVERERWARWFEHCIAEADDITDGDRAGLRVAVAHLRDDSVIERVRGIPL